jgi:hypothetical protein
MTSLISAYTRAPLPDDLFPICLAYLPPTECAGVAGQFFVAEKASKMCALAIASHTHTVGTELIFAARLTHKFPAQISLENLARGFHQTMPLLKEVSLTSFGNELNFIPTYIFASIPETLHLVLENPAGFEMQTRRDTGLFAETYSFAGTGFHARFFSPDVLFKLKSKYQIQNAKELCTACVIQYIKKADSTQKIREIFDSIPERSLAIYRKVNAFQPPEISENVLQVLAIYGALAKRMQECGASIENLLELANEFLTTQGIFRGGDYAGPVNFETPTFEEVNEIMKSLFKKIDPLILPWQNENGEMCLGRIIKD